MTEGSVIETTIPEGASAPEPEKVEAPTEPATEAVESAPAPDEKVAESPQTDFEKEQLRIKTSRQSKELARLNREIEELRKRAETHEVGAKANLPPEPDNFDSVAEYQKAVMDHYGAEAERKAEKLALDRARQIQESIVQKQRAEKFSQSYEKWKQEFPDYDAKITTLNGFLETLSDSPEQVKAVADAILDEPDPAAIGYYLASNPELLNRMYDMSPKQIEREIIRASETAKTLKAKPAKPLPKPLDGVKGGSKGAKSYKDLDSEDFLKTFAPHRY